jgi:hypothetical protein
MRSGCDRLGRGNSWAHSGYAFPDDKPNDLDCSLGMLEHRIARSEPRDPEQDHRYWRFERGLFIDTADGPKAIFVTLWDYGTRRGRGVNRPIVYLHLSLCEVIDPLWASKLARDGRY